MQRDTRVQITASVVAAAFLAASVALTTQISASVGRNRLVYTDSAEDGDRYQALGVAMGAFRGLFVNWLWIRANDLKEKGKYFEAIDLSKTITRLQPRFPKVWQFHAWNLAYNISVATQTPEERWNWVQSGIRLLRNEGIPNNPNSLDLHRELAWIHLHKVQGFMDDAHKYYKSQIAYEWSVVMGRPPQANFDDLADRNKLREVYAERWLKPIAEAPDTLQELYAAEPQAKELVERLAQIGLSPNKEFLERFELISAVSIASEDTQMATNVGRDPLAQLVAEDRYLSAGRALVRHVRKRVLIDEYHMEPDRMIRYTLKYGPLDWRHPAAHALYWSARGVEECILRVTDENRRDHDILNADRLTIQSVQELFRSGLVVYDIVNPEFYLTLQHTGYLDVYRDVLKELTARSKFDQKDRVYRFYWAGYENFMRDAIRYLYTRGDVETAKQYHQALYLDPDLNTNNPWLYEELAKPTDIFVQQEIVKDDRFTNPTVAMQEIAGSLMNAYIGGLGRGDEGLFRREFEYAQLFHARYQDSQAFRTWVSAQAENSGDVGRMGLPRFEIFAGQILAQCVNMSGIPLGPTIYRRAPAELQGRAYAVLERTALKAGLDERAKAARAEGSAEAPDFDRWFPPPAGIDQFRVEMFPENPIRTNDSGRIELK